MIFFDVCVEFCVCECDYDVYIEIVVCFEDDIELCCVCLINCGCIVCIIELIIYVEVVIVLVVVDVVYLVFSNLFV